MNTIHFTGTQVLFLMIITLAGVVLSVIFHFPLAIGFLPGFLVLVMLCVSKQIGQTNENGEKVTICSLVSDSRSFHPRVVCYVGKGVYSEYSQKKVIPLGQQKDLLFRERWTLLHPHQVVWLE